MTTNGMGYKPIWILAAEHNRKRKVVVVRDRRKNSDDKDKE